MYKVKVENLKQLNICISSKNVSEIILSRDSFAEPDLPKLINKVKKSGKLAWIMLERISRYEEIKDLRISTDKIFEISNLDGIIIQNLDSFAYMLRKINKAANDKLMVELNYTMNCYNSETKKVHKKLYNEKRDNANLVPLLFTSPVELNAYELAEVGYDTMIVYSYIDTMITANCLRKTTEEIAAKHLVAKDKSVVAKDKSVGAKHCEPLCKHRFDYNNVHDFSSYIIDRKGKQLHYKTYCKYCYNKIFNTEPLFLLNKLDEISKSKIIGAKHKSVGAKHCEPLCRYRIDLSFENEKEVTNILKGKCPDSFTRGHFKNSIN